jgi:hypothetical protein
MLRCSELGVTVWRNNCGILPDRRGIPVKFGVANPGGADLIGFQKVKITESHLGMTLAVFTAIECKDVGGKLSAHQLNFLNHVKASGGIAGVAFSPDEAAALLQNTTR